MSKKGRSSRPPGQATKADKADKPEPPKSSSKQPVLAIVGSDPPPALLDKKADDPAAPAAAEGASAASPAEPGKGAPSGSTKAADAADAPPSSRRGKADAPPSSRRGKVDAPPSSGKLERADEAFFAEGVRRSSMPPAIESDPLDARTVRLREDPEVLARRAQSVRMVRLVVGAVAVFFAIAVAVKLSEAPASTPTAPVAPSAAPAPLASATSSAPAPVAVDAASPSASGDAASSSSAVDAGASVSAEAGALALGDASVGPTSAATDAGGAADAGDAKALKRAAQRALDQNNLAAAITSAEGSVAADPTDAEAWLILGAAFDMKGRAADARAAYQSCVLKGKRGPVGECRALIR